ncbi:MAG: peptide chain release factor 1 [Spirochaetes bacterium]|nr:MAG: peptide chain release factor 1 [Spirochaetota bacterium]
MLEKLQELSERLEELEKLISDPDIIKDLKRYRELSKEHARLRDTVESYEELKNIDREIEEAKTILEEESDEEMKKMASEELHRLKPCRNELLHKLRLLLVPKDPLDKKDIIMEIRAGTGGEEAALFAADLFRMYSRFAELRGWKIEIMSSHPTEIGGFKEIIFSISGDNVYEELRYESGGHRVQRIPTTESGGRIHTSAVTVAVLPEAEETDIGIDPEDLKVDVFRSSGPGGQSVNTTDSAVRVTHLPSGLVVTCQDEKSQHKNKAKALRVLRARLYEIEERKKQQERAAMRRSQIGSGDRSQRIRTYNFPQNRVTDHRINLTLYKLESVMGGNLAEIIDALKLEYSEKAMTS